MRLINLLLAITLLAGATAAQTAQQAAAAASTATLEATTAWLHEKLPAFGNFAEQGAASRRNATNEASATFDGCNVSLRLASKANIGAISREVTFTLADLDAERTAVEPANGNYVLKLQTRGGAKRVRTDTGINLMGSVDHRLTFADGVSIPIEEKESAERLMRAFNHAATLCAGQKSKEPF